MIETDCKSDFTDLVQKYVQDLPCSYGEQSEIPVPVHDVIDKSQIAFIQKTGLAAHKDVQHTADVSADKILMIERCKLFTCRIFFGKFAQNCSILRDESAKLHQVEVGSDVASQGAGPEVVAVNRYRTSPCRAASCQESEDEKLIFRIVKFRTETKVPYGLATEHLCPGGIQHLTVNQLQVLTIAKWLRSSDFTILEGDILGIPRKIFSLDDTVAHYDISCVPECVLCVKIAVFKNRILYVLERILSKQAPILHIKVCGS